MLPNLPYSKNHRVQALKIQIPMSFWASLVAQSVKNPPAIRETWVWSLGWQDPWEKGMATHSSILAWKIPWVRSLVGYSPWGHKVRHSWVTNTSLHRKYSHDLITNPSNTPKSLIQWQYTLALELENRALGLSLLATVLNCLVVSDSSLHFKKWMGRREYPLWSGG